MRLFFVVICFLLVQSIAFTSQAQNTATHIFDPELNKLVVRQEKKVDQRTLRYRPDGEDFVIVNGNKRFNRALYGTNTGFRVETGDVPEFALYLPRMGGNLSFSLTRGGKTLQLNKAAHIESRYRAGTRIYTIKDPIMGKGTLVVKVLAMGDAEGMILRIEAKRMPRNLQLHWRFGGAADKRFSREGDLGVDPPDSFDLKPEYCTTNEYTLRKNAFDLIFGAQKNRKLTGVFPENATLDIEPSLPVLVGKMPLKTGTSYMAIQMPDNRQQLTYKELKAIYNTAEARRVEIASSLKITTPDPFFNTLGGTIATAADGIWDGKVWMHGAVGWRMPLNGWRAAYTGDVMGWHDRARIHFDAYAASQVTEVEPTRSHPAQDSVLNLARAEKSWGTPMYSNGYICRNPERNNQMHHYDMNLSYIDELLWHFNWTGDMDYVRKMWPTLELHLAWEKRNFDPDGDGLYNAYASIWASDALYYNSGGVTHASAFNYRANKMAAEIAQLIGKDPAPYKREAEKILSAINEKLWLTDKGHWAEFVDFMGEKITHESAAIWTVYHAIDSDIHDPYQAYQATRYVDTEIPHIPIVADGVEQGQFQMISTTNWLPYSWSINNVAIAEQNHMALAYWQAGRPEKAFNLLKSTMLDNMYLGSSPGNLGQISYYDAARGECYRDFGDPVGITSRTVVQGLFGILPDAMNDKLVLRPGFPVDWDHASIENASIAFKFKRKGLKSTYEWKQSFGKLLQTDLIIPVQYERIASVKVNGVETDWQIHPSVSGMPMIRISAPASIKTKVVIKVAGSMVIQGNTSLKYKKGEKVFLPLDLQMIDIHDPQGVFTNVHMADRAFTAVVDGQPGHRTFFFKMKQGQMEWMKPVSVEITEEQKAYHPAFSEVNAANCEPIELDGFFNDKVTNIFQPRYFSPRSPFTTLQIPAQGIGEWCHPTMTAEIDDSGLRALAVDNKYTTPWGFSFITPQEGANIIFTSQWDNFPTTIDIPLSGKAKNAYLMMAGSTNHMQVHLDNGYVVATYTDGSADTLRLVNPENWCPIEQDFYVDNQAFSLKTPPPYRLHLKSGLISNELGKDLDIDGVYGRRIPGGAGVLLDMPLNPEKELQKLTLTTRVNEILIGLMGLTLQR